jgi:hypothetical protein
MDEPQHPRHRQPGVDETRKDEKEDNRGAGKKASSRHRLGRVSRRPYESQRDRETEQRLARMDGRPLRKAGEKPERQEGCSGRNDQQEFLVAHLFGNGPGRNPVTTCYPWRLIVTVDVGELAV